MQMEWVFMGAVAVTAVILVLVIRRTVRMCAKTIFAQAEEPTPEEVKASQTPQALPEEVGMLPEELVRAEIEQAGQKAVLLWVQAVNSRNPDLLEGTGLQGAFAALQERQVVREERERFEQPKVHQSVICEIDPLHTRLVICVSAQAIHYTASRGQLVRGREDLPEQMLWQLVCENYREQPLQFQQIVQIK
ncbi:MAG: hypothetical protein Q4A63_07615 [Butyricicoccus pullicaecorum]|nr:hypothetical protein [Butyricicoccus pullicaecorum]MDO4669671.1 hypothetical protein [Butyricicoccus pullicaecorum]